MAKKHLRIYKTRWHLITTLLVIVAPFLFLLVFSELTHVAQKKLLVDVSVSFSRLLVAYIFAAFLGWLSAVTFYRGKRAAVALPIFDVLQSFPTFAALPLATFFWGKTDFTVIFFLIITIIWPIFFSVVSNLKLIKHDWEEAVEISGLSGWNYVRLFLWPVSISGLITGSIIGLGEGWEALVATEIIVGMRAGLGNFFQGYSTNPTITIFGILGFLILIFTINKLVWLPLLEWSHMQMEE